MNPHAHKQEHHLNTETTTAHTLTTSVIDGQPADTLTPEEAAQLSQPQQNTPQPAPSKSDKSNASGNAADNQPAKDQPQPDPNSRVDLQPVDQPAPTQSQSDASTSTTSQTVGF